MNNLLESFLVKARTVHGDTYEYSDYYKNNKTYADIICKQHGVFKQIPDSHLRGRGCPKCGNTRGASKNKSNTEVFIEKARLKHSDRYNYDKVIYDKSSIKVLIGCREHGYYEQKPNSHLSGKGCSVCAGHHHDTDSFVSRAREVHGDRYDYSLSEYTARDHKIKIICETHGDFLQTVREHLRGSGCQLCGNIGKIAKRSLPFYNFVKRASAIYDDKYEYIEESFEKFNKKMTIICPEHGSFRQTPSTFLSVSKKDGRGGCPKCNGKVFKVDFKDFVQRADNVHNHRYTYVESSYTKLMSNLTIICPEHGEFSQNASNHINASSGCPKCSNHISRKESAYLDSIGIPDDKEHRQVCIQVKGLRSPRVDGYDPVTKTIYEFDGDFWHGNPAKYHPDDINPVTKKTFGYHYQQTLKKKRLLEEAGYRVVSVWESDWLASQQSSSSRVDNRLI